MGQSNIALLYENFADRALLTGGGWRTDSLSLANLRTPYLPEVARSLTVQASDTWFDVVLQSYRPVGGLALGPCSITPFAQARIRAFDNPDGSGLIYDSGVIPFPGTRVDSTLLDWEDPGFWEGATEEFLDQGKGITLLHVLPTVVYAQNWRIEIFDASNTAGHLDIGRLFMGRIWQPKYNYNYEGNSLDFVPLTDMEEGRSGTRFFNARNMRRVFSFGFDYLPEAETFRDVYRIATRAGIHNQVVVIPNPSDPESFGREAFIGTLSQPPSLRRSTFGAAATSFKVEESL